ncbi:MAG TPA: type II secretion system protein [Candidatus Saccharimonadales bacterium]|nr:type II secretion system protein [Candidatus Saccharimonadales bacterium]
MKSFKQIKQTNEGGFTLLEVLLVVAIIAILASIVIIAINPAKQLADSRNSQRHADVNTILNAAYQYAVDNNGTLPTGVTTTDTEVCATATCAGLADLSQLTASGKYIVAIPKDPKCTDANGACYNIIKDANGRITVSAPLAELGKTISATR